MQWVQNKAERGGAGFSVWAKRPLAGPDARETSCPQGGPNLVGRWDKAMWSWRCHGLRGSRTQGSQKLLSDVDSARPLTADREDWGVGRLLGALPGTLVRQ